MFDALRAVWDRRKLMLCALLALAPLSCASLEGESLEGIKVTDLPVVSYPIAWMDNERILMRVDTGKRIDVAGGGQYATFDLISYNYKTGGRHNYGRVGQQICYADGYISHTRADDDDNKIIIAVYGELGKETTRRIRRGELNFERGARGSCRPWKEHPARPSWASKGTQIWFLWPRLGVIDCQTRAVNPFTKHIKARFHRPNDAVGVELPFSCEEVSGHERLRYYRYKGAYFALEYDYRHPWPEGKDRRAFWLYPDGRVETLTFRYTQAIREYAVPVSGGILAFSRPATRNDDYWVYFLTPNSSRRLFRGNATGATSPDGCKVAMLLDPDFKAKIWSHDVRTPASLKVLDFCAAQLR
jgi:hypothetical protein